MQQYGGQSVVTRILLVDDDPHLVPLIQRGLAYEGFEVYTAMDGVSGLAVARAHQPHIVLLDIAMLGLDGFEVCRRLRLHDAWEDVGPVLPCEGADATLLEVRCILRVEAPHRA